MKIHTYKAFTGSHSSSSIAKNDGKHANPPFSRSNLGTSIKIYPTGGIHVKPLARKFNAIQALLLARFITIYGSARDFWNQADFHPELRKSVDKL